MKIRKAILTGGGRATRLHPITTTINKHILPLANKPMIFHAIEKAVEVGVTEIFINTNPGDTELARYVGDGGRWGIKITFFEQTGGPQGIAHVVKEAERFIGGDPFMFYLSDNILLGGLQTLFDAFHTGTYDCMLALSEVPDPERFGVPIFNELNELVDVHEKPEKPPNSFAVTGVYLYGPHVFFQAFDHIEKSDRGEYEISSIHSHFLQQGMKVGYQEITGWWKDTGKVNDLLAANQLLLEKAESHTFVRPTHLMGHSGISGAVHIGNGCQLGDNVFIVGPVIIGENAVLNNCVIGPYTTLGSGVDIDGSRIEHSIILDNTTIHTDMHLAHSIVGKQVTLTTKKTNTPASIIVGDKTILEI